MQPADIDVSPHVQSESIPPPQSARQHADPQVPVALQTEGTCRQYLVVCVIGCPVPPVEQNDRERLLADLESALGATVFAAAFEAGHAVPHRSIVAEVLEVTTAP